MHGPGGDAGQTLKYLHAQSKRGLINFELVDPALYVRTRGAGECDLWRNASSVMEQLVAVTASLHDRAVHKLQAMYAVLDAGARSADGDFMRFVSMYFDGDEAGFAEATAAARIPAMRIPATSGRCTAAT